MTTNMAGMTQFYTILDPADPSCQVDTFRHPDGLNKARADFISAVCATVRRHQVSRLHLTHAWGMPSFGMQAIQRCSGADNAYAVDLPLVEPLGQDNAMYEGSNYLEWAARHEILLQVRRHTRPLSGSARPHSQDIPITTSVCRTPRTCGYGSYGAWRRSPA